MIDENNLSGGSGSGYTFSINGGAIFPIDSCIRVYANDLPYLVRVFDSEGCYTEKEVLVTQPDEIIVDLGDEVVVDLGEAEVIHLNTNAIVDTIVWDLDLTATSFEFLNSSKSEIEIEPVLNNTIYANVIDINGCEGSGEVNVIVNSLRNVTVPNIFSPNGDGLNDIFKVKTGKGVTKMNYMKIFDRWGELMHEEDNVYPAGGFCGSWDGTYKGSKLNPGVFVYMISISFNDNRTIVYRGSVTIVK
ncbi:MAG: gliding motility-associated C-terminal domain-containing protein [Saprospiraceae bacterium]